MIYKLNISIHTKRDRKHPGGSLLREHYIQLKHTHVFNFFFICAPALGMEDSNFIFIKTNHAKACPPLSA